VTLGYSETVTTERRPNPLLLPALLIGTFMGFLDLFIVTVALPPIRADLHAGVSAAQFVLDAYVLAYGVALVSGGRLGDRFGHRRLFVLGMAGFTVFSLACALAPDVGVLIAARAGQGLSAAAMLPQVLTTIQVVLPEHRRAAAIGAYGAVIGAASVCGQVLGGLLVDLDLFGLGWRSLFLINLPIGVAGVVLALRVVPRTQGERTGLDLRGLAAISACLVALLVGLTEGPDRHWPWWATACVVLGLLGAVVAALVERHVDRSGHAALVPPRIVAQRSVRRGLLLLVPYYASNTGFFVVLTFFLQNGLDASPLTAGLAFAPVGVGFSVMSIVGRARPSWQSPEAMAVGSAIMVAGLGAGIAVAAAGGGALALAGTLLVCGLGQGIVAPPLIGTVLRRVAPADAGAASGVLLTSTQVANALGIAVLGGIWAAFLGHGARTAYSLGAGAAAVLALLAAGAALTLRAVDAPAGGETERPDRRPGDWCDDDADQPKSRAAKVLQRKGSPVR